MSTHLICQIRGIQRFFLLIASLPFLLALTVDAQPLTVSEHLSVDDGLSHQSVTGLLRDRQGFLWIGTADGLNRYDGHEMSVFHNTSDSTSLVDNYVNLQALQEDPEGYLWIGTQNGLSRFDPHTEQFAQYKHLPSDPCSLQSDDILSLLHARGSLWIGTFRGLHRYDIENNCFNRLGIPGIPDSTGRAITQTLFEDRRGTLWVGTGHGLMVNNLLSDHPVSFTSQFHLQPDKLMQELSLSYVFDIAEDAMGNLWVGTFRHGLFMIDASRQTIKQFRHDTQDPYSLPDDRIMAVHVDGNGQIWVGTYEGGLGCLRPETGQFTRYAHRPGGESSLADYRITSLAEGPAGGLWVGTWRGVNRLSPASSFTVYTAEATDPVNLSHPDVSHIEQDEFGNLWISTTSDGLNRIDHVSGEVTYLQHDPRRAGSLLSNRISATEVDHQGFLWIGTFSGLSRFDPQSQSIVHFQPDPEDPDSLSYDRIYSVYEDHTGLLWIGTAGGGLNRFDRQTQKFTRFRHDPADSTSLSWDQVWPLFEDHTGTFWAGTFGGGLNRFDRQTQQFTRFQHDPDDPYSLSHDRVIAINEDAEGTLWVGTMGGGLNRFDRATERFSKYSVDEGLPDRNAACILPDEAGFLWVSTTNGLARFDPRTEQFRTYDVYDGLPSPIFSFNACHKGREGELYFGSLGGLVSFHPDSVRVNQHIPPVMLTDFELFNESVRLDTAITHIRQIRLDHDQNFVGFRYAALDFTAPAKNRYAHRLEGVDRDWVEAGARRYAPYANLAPGTYTFRVRASNNDGVWNEEGASVQLIITPPWWRTWWAYGLYLLLLGAALLGYVRWWLSRKEREQLAEHNARLAELDRTKSHFFANISHEFRTPLTLIMGPLRDILGLRYGALDAPLRSLHEMMLRNSHRLERLINQLLDLAKLEDGQRELKAQPQDLPLFVRKTVQPFAPLAESERITLEYPNPAGPCTVYFDPDALEKVLANLLSNAIKFTPEGGKVTVTVHQTSTAIEIAVRDTGPGIPPDEQERIFDRFHQVSAEGHLRRLHEGSGLGLALTKELTVLHRGTIKVESVVGRGSTFTVRLLLGKEHLLPHQIIEVAPDAAPVTRDEPGTRLTALPATTPEAPEPNPDEAEQGEDVTTVLIVDDNADIRSYVRSLLNPPYRVLEAADGVAGLACAQQALPDLIVADVMMPHMDGFSLLRALQDDPATDSIPVVLLTARAGAEDEQEGFETGAVGYVTKPFEARVLRAQVHSLIAFRRRLRERLRQARRVLVEAAVSVPEPALAEEARTIIIEHLHDAQGFSVAQLAEALNLSYSWMHHRFSEELNVTPSQFMRATRVEQAAQLLDDNEGNISEVAYAVGFKSLSYFTKCFRDRFEMNPSDYLRQRS